MRQLAYSEELLHEDGCFSTGLEVSVPYEVMLSRYNNGFYRNTESHYRKNVPATIDGMLGGLSYVHESETEWSREFLKLCQQKYGIQSKICLELGSGIGRVTNAVLRHFYKSVDAVEQCAEFSTVAPNIGQKIVCPLQQLKMQAEYDLVWIEWVIGHLTDDDLLELLRKCEKTSPYVILKENLCIKGWFFDKTDGNILRSVALFKHIVSFTNYEIVEFERPNTWPNELYPIFAIVLRRKCAE